VTASTPSRLYSAYVYSPVFLQHRALVESGVWRRPWIISSVHPSSVRMSLTHETEMVNYALLLCEAACHLLCQVLKKVL
jgi:hypothetical protein